MSPKVSAKWDPTVLIVIVLSLYLVNVYSKDSITNSTPCFVVKDYWPVKSCKEETAAEVCERGWGAWETLGICCAPGVAFPEGCGKKMDKCWVIESRELKTCIEDQRKCLQGYDVWPTQSACCKGAFKTACNVLPVSDTPCWVIDTYFPARLCRNSTTLCSATAQQGGIKTFLTQEDCCAPGSGAFQEGCSANPPPTPCWVVDSYSPIRTCRLENDISACNRGWGVYQSENICCAPNVGFPEGCSKRSNSSLAVTLP